MNKSVSILFACILICITVYAQPNQESSQPFIIESGKQIQWKLSSDTVPYQLKPYDQSDGFVWGTNNIENFGGTGKSVYGQISGIHHNGDSLYLVIDNINIDSISVYYYSENRVQQKTKAEAFKKAALTARAYVFKIPDPAGNPILLRFRSNNSIVLPVLVGNQDAFLRFANRKQLTESILLGITVFFTIFNLLMLLWSRDRNYLYYLAYSVFITTFCFVYLRGFSIYLTPSLFQFVYKYSYSIGALTNFFAVLFTRQFLKPFKNPRWINLILLAYLVYTLLVVALNIAGLKNESRILLQTLGLLTPLIVILYSIHPALSRDKAAIIFLCGWFLVGGCIFTYSLSIIGKIHFSWFTMSLLPLSTALIELLILTSALAMRFVQLQKEKKALTQQLLSTLELQKEELKQQVVERTFSLQQSNQWLMESNEVKARMISLISHDLKMPFVNLNAILDLLTGNLLTVEQSRRKLDDVKQSIGAISGTLENLLLWARQHQKSIVTRLEPVSLSATCHSIAQLLKLPLASKNLSLEFAFASDTVMADQFQLETILRNLVTNAIKPSPENGVITVGHDRTGNTSSIYVDNTGDTLNPDKFKRLMSDSSDSNSDGGKLLTGIGLQLCKEFLKNHHTYLQLQVSENRTRLYFQLPGLN